MSLYLPEQKLGSHSSEGSSSNKFMLKGRQTGSMHRGHSWVFRAESYDTMNAWYEDIRILTEKSPQERNAFVRQHAQSVSGTSQRAGSISSDGIMDEEDEEPFTASNPAVVNTGPKQDELPRRPQPGGRFPSDISLSRGLQAPLSPSSGSSGFGDVQDRDVVAAAGSLPGSAMHQYGGNAPPTHAAYVHQQAKKDGINPYTNQRMSKVNIHDQVDSHTHVGGVAGVAIGAVGVQTYLHNEDREAEKPRQEQENQAALEATLIAAPDTFEQESEQQAAHDAAIYTAPDHPLTSVLDSKNMTGGRSQGHLSANGAIFAGVADQEAEKGGLRTNPIEAVLRPLTEDTRPSLAAGQNHQSVQSVSQLHVPGEFPKDNTKAPEKLSLV